MSISSVNLYQSTSAGREIFGKTRDEGPAEQAEAAGAFIGAVGNYVTPGPAAVIAEAFSEGPKAAVEVKEMAKALAREEEERHTVEVNDDMVSIDGVNLPRKAYELISYAM
ncbi:MAG: hypothetical protein AB9903_05080 [Vulcanimicrobiota bacterium]